MLFYLSLWFVVIPIITINASFLNGFEINSQIIRECSLGRCDRCKASLKKWSECPARDCLFGLCMSNSTGNVYCPCTTINEPDNDFVETEKYDRYWVDPNDSCKTTTSPPDTTTCPLTTTSETTTICPITTTKEQPTTRQRKRKMCICMGGARRRYCVCRCKNNKICNELEYNRENEEITA